MRPRRSSTEGRSSNLDSVSNDPGRDPERALAAAARAAAKAAGINDNPGELDLSVPAAFPFGPLAFGAAFIMSTLWLGVWSRAPTSLVGVFEGAERILTPGEIVAYAVGIFSGAIDPLGVVLLCPPRRSVAPRDRC